jgi:K+-sensing histidine kinase KdpD
MGALQGISKKSRISLFIAMIIMMAFFGVETCIVFGLCEPTYFLASFGYACVIGFMPPFFIVIREFLQQKKATLSSLSQKNIYLEHAAKIIRHDMHSGINTYLPRGIKSLNRRLTEESIKELRIKAPLQLITDGLHHAQKVYAGVYEFTNLVKENAVLNTEPCNPKEILEDYLKLTAYKNQVIIDESIPKLLELNEALFCTAIDNLIRNGLKYNDSSTKWIKIYHEGSYHTGSFIVVEDNGRGITQEEFIELSKPYARKQGQQEQGTGLGLNICIEILKEHGFKISAEKKVKETGTKIKIEL